MHEKRNVFLTSVFSSLFSQELKLCRHTSWKTAGVDHWFDQEAEVLLPVQAGVAGRIAQGAGAHHHGSAVPVLALISTADLGEGDLLSTADLGEGGLLSMGQRLVAAECHVLRLVPGEVAPRHVRAAGGALLRPGGGGGPPRLPPNAGGAGPGGVLAGGGGGPALPGGGGGPPEQRKSKDFRYSSKDTRQKPLKNRLLPEKVKQIYTFRRCYVLPASGMPCQRHFLTRHQE